MQRFVVASAIALVMAAGFLPGSGVRSSAAAVRGAQAIPGGLADAIHAQLGPAPIGLASRPPARPEMGFWVALSADGTTALVAAPGVAGRSGAVYVYHAASAGAWTSSSTPAATLTSPGTHGGFGDRVVLSADGTTAFIGAPRANPSHGRVYVFHVSDEASWASTSTPTATLTVTAGQAYIGDAMAISGDGTTLVLGADFSNGTAGGAFIFHASAEDGWVSGSTPTARLSVLGAPKDEFIGDNVVISDDGTTALLSDPYADPAAAYLFHVASEAAWVTSSSPTSTLSNDSGFANIDSMALSGDGTTAFVGGFDGSSYAGAVDVFHAAAADAWPSSSTPTAVLTNATGGRHGFLGEIVRASTDGTTVLARDDGAGAVDVFHASGEDAWATTSTPTAALTEPTRGTKDLFGIGLAISADGTTALVGAPEFDWETGKAEVFHAADASSWLTSSSPAATLTNSALPKPVCVVPRLKGLYPVGARVVLEDWDCRLGTVKRVHVDDKSLWKRVVSQSIAPGVHRAAGWKVNIRVGRK